MRSRFAGAPSFGPLPDYGEASALAQKVAVALDPINDAPYCIQWAIVERGKDAEPHAHHEGHWAAALSNMVRALHLLAVEHTRTVLSLDGHPRCRIDYFEPTLFVKTRSLFLYDVASRKLTPTNRLSLAQNFEVAGGQQDRRLVDVVSDRGLADFILRYKAVKENLDGTVDAHGAELIAAAEEQRRRFASENSPFRGMGLGMDAAERIALALERLAESR